MRKKGGDAGPVFVSCWPLFEVISFIRDTVKHKRLAYHYIYIYIYIYMIKKHLLKNKDLGLLKKVRKQERFGKVGSY